MFLVIAVDNLLNETELEIVVYTGQLDLIVDTLGKSRCYQSALHIMQLLLCLCA